MDWNKTIIKKRQYKKWGYELRDESIIDKSFGSVPITVKSAYTLPEGEYIGSSKDAYDLCTKRGIKPEKRTSDSGVCSIGFCHKELKWYGWSHRAIYGFGVGSKVTVGHCGYGPANPKEFIEMMKLGGEFKKLKNLRIIKTNTKQYKLYAALKGKEGIIVSWDQPKREKGQYYSTPWAFNGEDIEEGLMFIPYPAKWGKGTWTAKNLNDAKEMAENFAESVS